MKIKSTIIHALGGVTREEHDRLLLRDRPKPVISFYTPRITPIYADRAVPGFCFPVSDDEVKKSIEADVTHHIMKAVRPYIQFEHYNTANEHRCRGVLQIIPPPIFAKFRISKGEE